MTYETIAKIKEKIQQEQSLTAERKAGLLKLLSTLEAEVASLSLTHPEHAESIAGFMERSAHEATRRQRDPELLGFSLAGLRESVRGFEASHPALTGEINTICTSLATMGI